MRYTALKDFTSTAHGNVSAGDIIEVASGLGLQWEAAGMVAPFNPAPASAAGVPSSSSPRGQALPDGNATTYETKPFPASPRTPAFARFTGPASSTDATQTGGDATTKKPRAPGTSAGRKASKRSADTI